MRAERFGETVSKTLHDVSIIIFKQKINCLLITIITNRCIIINKDVKIN